MGVLSRIWQWLLDENNRSALALVGATISVGVGAWWAIFRYRRKHKDTRKSINAGPSAGQIQAIIEPLLAANKDQAARNEELSRQLGISESVVSGFFATLGPPTKARRSSLPTGDLWPTVRTGRDRPKFSFARFPSAGTSSGYR